MFECTRILIPCRENASNLHQDEYDGWVVVKLNKMIEKHPSALRNCLVTRRSHHARSRFEGSGPKKWIKNAMKCEDKLNATWSEYDVCEVYLLYKTAHCGQTNWINKRRQKSSLIGYMHHSIIIVFIKSFVSLFLSKLNFTCWFTRPWHAWGYSAYVARYWNNVLFTLHDIVCACRCIGISCMQNIMCAFVCIVLPTKSHESKLTHI